MFSTERPVWLAVSTCDERSQVDIALVGSHGFTPWRDRQKTMYYMVVEQHIQHTAVYLRPGSWAPPGHASWHWQIHWRPPCCQSLGRRPVGHHATDGRSAWPGCTSAPWEWHSLSPPGDAHDQEKRGRKKGNVIVIVEITSNCSQSGSVRNTPRYTQLSSPLQLCFWTAGSLNWQKIALWNRFGKVYVTACCQADLRFMA